MKVEAFRIENFMGFEDSGWLELRPITLLFGRNSSGKSAILRALLLLRQSLRLPSAAGPFQFVKENEFDFGSFSEVIRFHKRELPLIFSFRLATARNERITSPEVALKSWEELGGAQGRIYLSLKYTYEPAVDGPVLTEMDLYDEFRTLVMRASATGKPGGGSPWKFESQTVNFASLPEPNVWPYLELYAAGSFLPSLRPTQGSLVSLRPDPEGLSEFEERPTALGKEFQDFWQLLGEIRSSLFGLLESIVYLNPLREPPKRIYFTGDRISGWSRRSWNPVSELLQPDEELLARVNKWLAHSSLEVQLDAVPLNKRMGIYELRVVEQGVSKSKHFSANISDVGFGISQVLPVVAQMMLSDASSTVLVEQPELHLHPRAQAELANLFIATTRRNVAALIETHSEHLLLRLQREIARTSARMVDSPTEHLEPERVAIYFVERDKGCSSVTRIEIDEYGEFTTLPDGFRGFFSDDAIDTAERMMARLRARKRAEP